MDDDPQHRNRTIRVIDFDGTEGDFDEWREKTMSIATTKEFESVLDGTLVSPTDDEHASENATDEIMAAYKLNAMAYHYLILACQKTSALKHGDAHLAWTEQRLGCRPGGL
jgi:hypothetical protein